MRCSDRPVQADPARARRERAPPPRRCPRAGGPPGAARPRRRRAGSPGAGARARPRARRGGRGRRSRVRRRWRSSSPRSRKSARASCSTTGVPRSSAALAATTTLSSSTPGATSQPSRSPGASDLLTEPRVGHLLGGQPLHGADRARGRSGTRRRSRPRARRAPVRAAQSISAARRSGASTTPSGNWWAGAAKAASGASASSTSTRRPSASTGTGRTSSPLAASCSRPGVLDGSSTPMRRPPCGDQRPRDQRHALGHAGGDDDALGVAGHAAGPAQVARQRRAQLGRAARVAVVEPRVGGVAQRPPQRGQPGRAREQRHVGAPGTEVEARRPLGRRAPAARRRAGRRPRRRAWARPGGRRGSPPRPSCA